MNVCNRTQSSCVRTLKDTMFEFGQIIQQWKTACWAVECSLLPALDHVCITHCTHQNTFPGQKASQGQTMSFISTRSPRTRIQMHLFCRLKWWCSAWPPLESPGEFQKETGFWFSWARPAVLRAILLPPLSPQATMSGDILACHNWEEGLLLASRG